MNALIVVAQVIPVLMLGVIAELRAVILVRSHAQLRTSALLVSGSSLIGLALIEIVALEPLATIPDSYGVDVAFPLTLGAWALGMFLLSTAASALVSLRALGPATRG